MAIKNRYLNARNTGSGWDNDYEHCEKENDSRRKNGYSPTPFIDNGDELKREYERGFRDALVQESYKKGYRDGYEAAKRELKESVKGGKS